MNDIWLFVLGSLIFGGYRFGLSSMCNKQHKTQEREQVGYGKVLAKRAAEASPAAETKD
jgi:hypothetical protein